MVRFDNLPIGCVQHVEEDVCQTQMPTHEATLEAIQQCSIKTWLS
jgi:hypothetical protein